MRVALISDIHGNRWALDAVLDHIAGRRVEAIWNLGDILSGPLEPAATADMLMPLALPTISGNCDRGLLECAASPGTLSDQFAFAHTDPRHHDWFCGLPSTLVPRADVLLCHGSPRSDTEPLLETIEPDGLRCARHPEIDERVVGQPLRLIACGHTHIPRMAQLGDGRVIVNPGSVGLPAYDDPNPLADPPAPYYVENGSPHASYAILDEVDGGWEVSFHRVVYDWEAAAACAARNGRPEWAYALRTGFALRASSTT
jgi:predicted phosphodiesterase